MCAPLHEILYNMLLYFFKFYSDKGFYYSTEFLEINYLHLKGMTSNECEMLFYDRSIDPKTQNSQTSPT